MSQPILIPNYRLFLDEEWAEVPEDAVDPEVVSAVKTYDQLQPGAPPEIRLFGSTGHWRYIAQYYRSGLYRWFREVYDGQQCRVCGCTEVEACEDCESPNGVCEWAEPDLCAVCAREATL